MKELTELRENWVWPKDDKNCWAYMKAHPTLPQEISSYVEEKKVCVQAGGNMGYYVKQYSQLFDHVYTFEPEPLNFFCLNQNIQTENVYKFQSCLGYERHLVSLNIKPKNRGKNHVSGHGIIPTLRIDDLNLVECSLIHLDIEGYEYFALQGSVETIKKCKPVIAIEFFEKCADRFNYNLNDVENFFQNLNYKLIKSLEEERIYVHESIYNNIKI
jgi:FkbM family methyltransferase